MSSVFTFYFASPFYDFNTAGLVTSATLCSFYGDATDLFTFFTFGFLKSLVGGGLIDSAVRGRSRLGNRIIVESSSM